MTTATVTLDAVRGVLDALMAQNLKVTRIVMHRYVAQAICRELGIEIAPDTGDGSLLGIPFTVSPYPDAGLVFEFEK